MTTTHSMRKPAPAGSRLVIADLCKSYRMGDQSVLTAADDVNLEIAPGTITAITGPSGSGKSTLLHLIGAIDRADSGRILVDDTDITGLRGNALADYRASVGFIFQQFHLVPSLTAFDNVLAPLVSRKTSFDRRSRAQELLAEVGLDGRERALPSHLSGGQQQRVAIARALVNSPGLILADEPTGNLDAANAAGILKLLRRLQEAYGTTILIATHDAAIASRADSIVTVRDGRTTVQAGD
ncbi:ABC transporter ATP-binding protein [Flexivirga caeni]|uniref:ABC transporter ATP-binding protein n=1 Tax=Flexivirga caeni TaxID=2294115 RepID=A0A3M9M983_9MICO|nr:ABC transporter ATP-binding protein [Flexivirga caeni]RNI22131.1 ABC transporter ATP-binding protein [Flexivirga caeni]